MEATGWDRDRGFSYVDVDAVDPEEYPGVAKAPWYQIHVNKGDCVFIPNRYCLVVWHFAIGEARADNTGLVC